MFRFTGVRCESCHKDQHGGQFKSLMAQQSCAACHSTEEWKLQRFDHSKTSFVLAGKHATVPCSGCHKPQKNGKAVVVQYRGVTTRCESCHTDPHARQFDVSGSTSCTGCHTSEGWQQLVFDHNRQSTFQLTGAHVKVQCRACHKEERLGRKVVIQYKPISTKCESCHTQNELKK